MHRVLIPDTTEVIRAFDSFFFQYLFLGLPLFDMEFSGGVMGMCLTICALFGFSCMFASTYGVTGHFPLCT